MSDGKSAAITRKALEAEIAAHAEAIIDLKGRMNTLTAIARLPPELLSEVFLQVAKGYYDQHADCHHLYYRASRFYEWVKVSHVCRGWRAVALNTPRLWGHIILTKRAVVSDVLARSKKAPLLVCASLISNSDERMRVLEDVIQDPSRLREFRLSGPARLLQDFCPKFAGPASNLETLVLSDNASHSYLQGVGDTALSPELFEGQLPRLRSLEIHKLVFSWRLPVLSSGLTRLVLAGRLDSQSLLGTFDQLLATLENMSRLELLQVDDAIPRLPAETTTLPTPQHTVTLPRLRRITLTGQCLDCANLIHHLSLPPTTRIKLTGRGHNGGKELIRILGGYVGRSDPLLTMRISSAMYSSQIQMRGWRTLVDPTSLAPEPCIELCIDALVHSRLANEFIGSSKMFTQVRRLDIETAFHCWRWKDVFSGMPNLRTLSICGNPKDELITALSTVRRGKKKRPPLMVLPHLRVLKFTDARMCSTDYDDPPEFLDLLEDWLLMRCNYDLPIEKLYLTQCTNITEEDVERLDQIVPYVEWDGVVEFESDDEEEEEEEFDAYDPYFDDEFGYDYDDYGDPWGFF